MFKLVEPSGSALSPKVISRRMPEIWIESKGTYHINYLDPSHSSEDDVK